MPPQSDLKPNTSPIEGSVAIFDYKGTPHVAIVMELEETGYWVDETNYHRGEFSHRFVKWNDPAQVGFYVPAPDIVSTDMH